MNFTDHSDLQGQHAFLSASKYFWVNYDDEKLEQVYRQSKAAEKGSRLHAFAAEAISLNQKLPRTRQTLNLFVNDAIGFRMSPEVVLYYSPYAFGTADAISFKNNFLRIHDLKTGVTRVSFVQLEVYAAFFCLEYGYKPTEIKIELRIYQNDDVLVHIPEPEEIVRIMSRVQWADKAINRINREG